MKHLALLLIALWPLQSTAADFPAKVVGVSDGDTITVLTAEKRQVKIRLDAVDAPETSQAFGSRSKQSASEMAFGKEVMVKDKGTDRYGRTLAEVILPDGKSLNREQCRSGMAWWYSKYAPNDREMEALEKEAREAKRGLWADGNPIPPWEWRNGKGVPTTAGVVGNKNSHIYHAPNCRSVGRMKEANRVEFKSVEEAEKAGYRKAGDCG